MAGPGSTQDGVQWRGVHDAVRDTGAALPSRPTRNTLEIRVFWSDIRPVLMKSGADDDNCVARWDEVG
jgi:hypothetical protein